MRETAALFAFGSTGNGMTYAQLPANKVAEAAKRAYHGPALRGVKSSGTQGRLEVLRQLADAAAHAGATITVDVDDFATIAAYYEP